ncbi:hypothetical protein [Planomicrobium okeanokoites]|uniref:Uncharacterized protein n=1 Tax=Planomicrobium okeanokoites TaxID=244 RepID=A0ABV7KQT1_PLAOK|nr:hypothetical protein [Planomicrobium okeanokoites]TAA70885.1 hypothetical protein D2910_00990 [Planomicrobium okeanokoites]
MIQIFITVITAALILPLAYFQFKETPLPKRMLIAGSIVAAALVSAFLQMLEFAFYIPLLAIVAISMIGAIVYAKIDEMEKAEKRRIADERKEKRQKAVHVETGSLEENAAPVKAERSLYDEPVQEKKSFAMQTIGVGGEER